MSNTLPALVHIRRHFPRDGIADIPAVLRAQLELADIAVPPGARIAVAVGSRGIAHLDIMVGTVIAWLRTRGAEPFLVPAMGSHGGATAEGQRAVLEGYGLAKMRTGVPIHSSMDVVQLPAGNVEVPVFLDRYAAEADGIVVLNRIKPHTSFRGRYESGLLKMIAIGLGKERQARALHRLGLRGLREVMPQVARQVLRHGRILLGIAVVENAWDEPCIIEAIPAAEIPEREPALLQLAASRMPHLPVEEIDLLIVDEIGKDISGLGMDPNVVGRLKIPGESEPAVPRIKVIFVRDLSPGAQGNAAGMGLADLIARRAVEKIDFAATYANVATTGFLERGKLPVVAEDDETALCIAAQAWGPLDPADARIVHIKNTLRLADMYVSPRVLADLQGRNDFELFAGEVERFP